MSNILEIRDLQVRYGGIEAVRMREHEEAVLTRLGLPRNESYFMEEQ